MSDSKTPEVDALFARHVEASRQPDNFLSVPHAVAQAQELLDLARSLETRLILTTRQLAAANAVTVDALRAKQEAQAELAKWKLRAESLMSGEEE